MVLLPWYGTWIQIGIPKFDSSGQVFWKNGKFSTGNSEMVEVRSVPDKEKDMCKGPRALQLWISGNDKDGKRLDLWQINGHEQYPRGFVNALTAFQSGHTIKSDIQIWEEISNNWGWDDTMVTSEREKTEIMV